MSKAPETFNSTSSKKEFEFLRIDEQVRGQNYCCISFVEPEDDVFVKKETFSFSKFIPTFLDKFYSEFCHLNGLKKDEVKQPEVSLSQLREQYDDFKATQSEMLTQEYSEQSGNRTNLRAVKVRGSYETLQEAQMKAKELQRDDPNFNVFVGQVGYWLPFNPVNINDIKPEYMNEELNKLVHGHIENQENMKHHFNERMQRMKELQQSKKMFEDSATHEERKVESMTI